MLHRKKAGMLPGKKRRCSGCRKLEWPQTREEKKMDIPGEEDWDAPGEDVGMLCGGKSLRLPQGRQEIRRMSQGQAAGMPPGSRDASHHHLVAARRRSAAPAPAPSPSGRSPRLPQGHRSHCPGLELPGDYGEASGSAALRRQEGKGAPREMLSRSMPHWHLKVTGCSHGGDKVGLLLCPSAQLHHKYKSLSPNTFLAPTKHIQNI